MIQSLVGVCIVAGFAIAKPLALKGLFVPAPLGNRPACAEKTLTFCEKVDNYPSELIERLLKSKNFDINDFIVDESEGLEDPPEHVLNLEPPPPSSGRNRKTRSFVSDGEKLTGRCSVPSRMATPKIASNSKGEWRFIAQEESAKIHQEVEVHICSEKMECQKSCTQFYTPVSMKSFASSGKVIQDIFWFPSSCRCSDNSENAF